MLKVALAEEEKAGGAVIAWWNGIGAARVLEHDGDALLLERAEGARSLSAMALDGHDDEATHILCDVIATLHRERPSPPPPVTHLTTWFHDLSTLPPGGRSLIAQAADAAASLLASQQDPVVLHGDVHHGNVLDFGDRGWLAIDPKGLFGERTFDYVNLFRNPDIANPSTVLARDPARFSRRLDIVVERGGVDRQRLLLWILAFCGLSAVWTLADQRKPIIDLFIGGLAAQALGRA